MSGMLLLFLTSGLLAGTEAPASADVLHEADRHFLHGRYEEAEELLQELLETDAHDPLATSLLSRVLQETGRSERAFAVVESAVKEHSDDLELLTRRAELRLLRGRLTEAEADARKVLQANEDSLRANWVLASVLNRTGRLTEADASYRWFVRYYNRVQPEDATELLWVGKGSAEYARWHGVSQIFDFLVNTLCVDALKQDADAWPILQLSGTLLLEKYNKAESVPEFEAALAINPRAVPAIQALGEAATQDGDWAEALRQAERALEINAESVRGLSLKALALYQSGQVSEARRTLEMAAKLDPTDEDVAAGLAACCVLTENPVREELVRVLDEFGTVYDRKAAYRPGRSIDENASLPACLSRVLNDVGQRNPHAGRFLTTFGNWMDSARRYPLAEAAYERATLIMPQLSEPRSQLAILAMRMGRLETAEELLDAAFKADPYHVRISNMRKVVDVVSEYQVIASDHFVVRYDAVADGTLGPYVSEYLESIYPELVERFGFEPPARTQFELFHDSRGLPGQQWFAARMVGLPRIHTIGASTGMIVALTSPTSLPQAFNWARVLKHEFVHVITLQQTDFRIPHWFTEALAVDAEGDAVPEEWERMLLERTAKDDLRPLAKLNEGFMRAESQADWNFNYYQSLLCLHFIRERWGQDADMELLNAFRSTATLEEAMVAALNISTDDFQTAYRKYLFDVAESLKLRYLFAGRSVDSLRAEVKKVPDDATVGIELAVALSLDGEDDEAKTLAEQLWSEGHHSPRLAVILVAEPTSSDEFRAAWELLGQVPDADRGFAPYLLKLAEAAGHLEEWDAAWSALERFAKDFPEDPRGPKLEAKIAERANRPDREIAALKRYLDEVSDDGEGYLRILDRLADASDHDGVLRFGRQALHLLPVSVAVHRHLAVSYAAVAEPASAAREWEVVTELQPDSVPARIGLIDALQDSGRPEQARDLLDELTRDHADDPAVQELRQRILDDDM